MSSLPRRDVWNLTYTALPADSGAGRLASVSRAPSVTGASGAGPFVSAVIAASGRLCVDIAAADTTDGNKVQIWRCNGTGAQAWAFNPDGTIRALGKCLDVAGSGTANGTLVDIFTCDGSAGQQWTAGSDGSLVNPNSGRCLDDPVQSATIGTQLQIWTCNGTAAQTWTGSLSTLVYKVPVSGAGAPYDLSGTQTARWYQNEPPTDATAVFPPTQLPTGHQATGVLPSSYERATVSYLDANARHVNTATPGGHIDTTWYDLWGNTTRTLTDGNRRQALDLSASDTVTEESGAARAFSTLNNYSSDGRRMTNTMGPEHEVMLNDGNVTRARNRTEYSYDEGAPTGGPFDLVTTEVDNYHWYPNGYPSGVTVTDGNARTSKTEYDWTLRQPTKVTQDYGGLNLATRTSYDPVTGLVVAVTAPAGGAVDTTPSTRKTIYYRATTGSGYAECNLRPEWANLPCRIQPGGQPATGPELPAAVTTYDMFNQPRVVTEKTAAGALRTTTTSYDGAGRTFEETVTAAAGLGTAVPRQRTIYDTYTGQATHTQTVDSGGAVTAEIVRQYDTLGRLVTYTDTDGNTATTTYDLMSRPAVTNDGKAARTHTYDGGTERRGLLTSVDDTQAGAFGGSYDNEGRLASETWPNGIVVTTSYDETGTPIQQTYTKPGCGQPDCTLYTENVTESIHGQQRQHTSNLSAQGYGYDNAGRLTTTADTLDGQCTTRAYGYNTASDRTTLTEYAPDAGGACQQSAPATPRTWTYDTADRITTAGTVYDALGRTTTVPGADTTNPAGGNLTVGYHHTDLVDTISQGSRTTDYTLDVTGERIRSWTDNASGTAVTATHHYDSDDDNPAWTQEDAGRYSRVVTGMTGMAGTWNSDTATLAWQLTNLHGDLIATINGSDPGLSATHEATEYGAPRNTADIGTRRYGWLGAKQRAADTPTGIILMGVRLYNTTTGRFLQVDPVYGGSANAYDYCAGDPINCFDLDGRWGWKRLKRWAKRALNNSFVRGAVASIVVGAVCVGSAGIGCAVLVGAAAGAALGGANWYVNHRRENAWRHIGFGALSGAFGGGFRYGAARYAARYGYKARHSLSIRHGVQRHRYYGGYTRAKHRFQPTWGWSARTVYRGIRGRYRDMW